jgi:beta-fructofuranosidase
MSPAADGSPMFTARRVAPVDEGRSLYAPQVAIDPDGPWFVGWVMQVGAPDRQLAGCLTLVRRLRLEGDRLLSRVDGRQAALLGAVASVDEDGTLPAYAHLEAREEAVTVRGQALSVTVQPGAEAWFDGEVLEVYPADAPPRTYRDPGTAAWRLAEPQRSTVIRWAARVIAT